MARKRIYTLNESYFEQIDTEDKAYWLGFITADGCLYKNQIQISLSIKDEKHLYKFLKNIGTNKGLYYKNVRGMRMVSAFIDSNKLVNDLKNLGLTCRKSFTAMPCLKIPSELYHHYLRGIYDGDGTISVSTLRKNGKTLTWTVGVCGSYGIVKDFNDYMNDRTKSNATLKHYRKIYQLNYCGTLVCEEIVNILYKNASIYLDRKKEKADELLNQINYRKTKYSKEKLQFLYDKFGTWKQVREKLNIGASTLYRHRHKIV